MSAMHPGEILSEEFLKPNGISAYRLAAEIFVPITRITSILHGKRSISIDTARRFSRYFGFSVDFWLNLQRQYDLENTPEDPELRHISHHSAYW